MRHLVIAVLRVYQLLLSPWFGGHCRFTPTCSHYAIGAVSQHGTWRGGALAARRLLRCHPWVQGGHDPVPGREARHG